MDQIVTYYGSVRRIKRFSTQCICIAWFGKS